MTDHKIVSQAEWDKTRVAFLQKETELNKTRERLAEERRQLPWVKIEKTYMFDTPTGKKTLSDLFDGRSQLFVQHFMFTPEWDAGCTGCSFAADHIDAAWQHIRHHDLSFVAVARAPIAKLEAYRKRMGWHFPFVSSAGSDFNYDFHVSWKKEDLAKGKVQYNYEMIDNKMEDLPGGSVFFKDKDGSVYLTYTGFGDTGDEILGAYILLDMTPKGRNEAHFMEWVKRHDEYEDKKRVAE
jgi:predicted dithiol-disulfide oxidoreductase (DUF899 family)